MIYCQICNKQCKNYISLVTHINKAHNISSKDYYDTYIKTENDGICVICGKSTYFRSISVGYRKHCSTVCSSLDKEVQAKNIATNRRLYGVDNAMQSSIIQEKVKQTNRIRYNCDYTFQSEVVKEKCKQIHIQTYGVENPFQSKEIKEKIKKKHLENLGVEYPQQNKDIANKTQQSIAETRRKNNNRSMIELYFEELCDKYNIKYIHNYQDDRYIRSDGYKWKCDYYFPEDDLFIEIHFMATHNNHLFNEKDPNDLKWLEHCKTNPRNWVEELQVNVWANNDVEKVKIAKQNKLNYKILWSYLEIDKFFEEYNSERNL